MMDQESIYRTNRLDDQDLMQEGKRRSKWLPDFGPKGLGRDGCHSLTQEIQGEDWIWRGRFGLGQIETDMHEDMKLEAIVMDFLRSPSKGRIEQ